MIEMRSQYKAMLISGLLILLVWVAYVTFIYMDHIPEGMDGSCWFNINAGTDTCRGIASHYGGYP